MKPAVQTFQFDRRTGEAEYKVAVHLDGAEYHAAIRVNTHLERSGSAPVEQIQSKLRGMVMAELRSKLFPDEVYR